ncbi:hypothetical protein AB3N58_06830 [Leptospira sp. WS60.C2]
MLAHIDTRLRFSETEFSQEFILRDWTQFKTDIEEGKLLNIDEILEDYYYGNIGIEDILSTFPPTEQAFLVPGKHDRLISIYKKLFQEFPGYGSEEF